MRGEDGDSDSKREGGHVDRRERERGKELEIWRERKSSDGWRWRESAQRV